MSHVERSVTLESVLSCLNEVLTTANCVRLFICALEILLHVLTYLFTWRATYQATIQHQNTVQWRTSDQEAKRFIPKQLSSVITGATCHRQDLIVDIGGWHVFGHETARNVTGNNTEKQTPRTVVHGFSEQRHSLLPDFPQQLTHLWGWLGGVMVRTLDLWLAVAGSNPGHDTAWLFLR